MRDVVHLFEKFLASRDLRLTRQRAEILRAMYATHKHINADDLYDLLRREDTQGQLKISRATVYRTLSLLTEGGFIQALELGTEHGTLYEHVLGHGHHDHMICLTCGRIIEFLDDELERVQSEAVARHGFEVSWHRLNVYGKCVACQRKASQTTTDSEGPDDAESEGESIGQLDSSSAAEGQEDTP